MLSAMENYREFDETTGRNLDDFHLHYLLDLKGMIGCQAGNFHHISSWDLSWYQSGNTVLTCTASVSVCQDVLKYLIRMRVRVRLRQNHAHNMLINTHQPRPIDYFLYCQINQSSRFHSDHQRRILEPYDLCVSKYTYNQHLNAPLFVTPN